MKKTMTLILSTILTAIFLTGCSLDSIVEKVVPQALGIGLYGESDQVHSEIERFDDYIVDHAAFDIKKDEGDQTIIAMSQSQAEKAFELELWNEVMEGDKTRTLKELPKASDEKPVLFTKTDKTSVNFAGEEIDVRNEGNVLFGNSRAYTDMYLIVTDKMYEQLAGDEKAIGFLKFHEDHNPKHKLNDFKNIDYVQLIDSRK